MKDYNEKLIEAKTLANGVKLSLFDFCKQIAGDRWYVKILCRIELNVPGEKLAGSGLDAAGQTDFNEGCEGVLVHEFTKERNFIDESVKDEVISEIISQINENSLSYVANPVFADNLFRRKIDQFIKEQDLRRQIGRDHDVEEEEDGPADFSSCFKD